MRLVIDLDKKYKNLFYEVVKATKSSIVEEKLDFWNELPEHVKAGIEKSQEQAKNGQTKSFKQVKKILAGRHVKD